MRAIVADASENFVPRMEFSCMKYGRFIPIAMFRAPGILVVSYPFEKAIFYFVQRKTIGTRSSHLKQKRTNQQQHNHDSSYDVTFFRDVSTATTFISLS